MDFLSPAGDWIASGENKFFEKAELYSMVWTGVSLQTLRLGCAKNGGPIATTRDERQVVVVATGSVKPVIKIHNAAGHLLGAFAWERNTIVGIGWSEAEDLVIVENTGEVTLYRQDGTKQERQFSFGERCQQEGVSECHIYEDGLVALTKQNALWSITNIQEPRLEQLAAPKLAEAPLCMTVIPPSQTLSGAVEVLLGCENGILAVDAESVKTVATGKGPIRRLAVAPNGQFVAAFTGEGRLFVWLSDFTSALSEFATESTSPPDSVAWCGADSVVMAWPDLLLVVGPYGDWVNFPLDQHIVLVQEIDGVRILSADTHAFLRRVPAELVDIFKIGSTAPGALLFDARIMFDQHNPKSDEVLRSIRARLPEAISTCVGAAGAEFEVPRQAILLKAACLGRAFCPAEQYPRKKILEACRVLRVLNALREPDVGRPMTLAQLEALGMPAVLLRLVRLKQHLLALRVASLLDLSPEQVLVQWACDKIGAAGSAPDEQLRDAIVAKFQGRPAVRFTDIAAAAQSAGRKGLAAMLLEHETLAAEQVPLLLRLGEDARALARATESGDTDLVYLVLFSMYRTLPFGNFVAALATRPRTRSLFLAHCSRTEPELMEKLCMAMGLPDGVAALRIRTCLRQTNDVERLREGGSQRLNAVAIGSAVRLLEQAADLYSETKEHGFQSKAAAEFAKLRKFQAELEDETGNACFVGLSVVATAQQCLVLGNLRAAHRVQAEFKISDRRFWWLHVRVIAAAKDWDSLLAVAQEKKSPVGVDRLIGVSKEYNAPTAVTAQLIAKLPDGKAKAEEYTAIKMYQEAAETAAHSRDSAMLSTIQGLVGSSSPLGLAVTQIKDRLQAGTK